MRTHDKAVCALNELSTARKLLAERKVSEAARHFTLAAESGADGYECAAGRWECRMLLGDLEAAWAESDFIAAGAVNDPNRLWNGESWQGRRVMLRCLHGLGDAIQFIRYAPLLRQSCAKLIVQTHPELVRLLGCVSGIDEVITWRDETAADHATWDLQMEVMELPRAFRTVVENIPAKCPYISIPEDSKIWASDIVPPTGKRRIGVVWESSCWDQSRCVPPALLEQLAELRRCEFFSFQKEGRYSSIARDLSPYLGDVLDAAALMTRMDLLVTVDTMAAHLAGALSVPAWIMLPAKADWRWMLERTDSPWYPQARLFRQREQANWAPVIGEVISSLQEFA